MNGQVKHCAFRFILTLLVLVVSRVTSGQSPVSAADSTPPSPEQPSVAGEETAVSTSLADSSVVPRQRPLADLTLDNFFSAGWNDDFAMRSRATSTPDLTLLRVQPNLLLRLFRGNFFEETNITSATRKDLTNFDGFIDWGFNRRVMLEVNGAYQWVDPRTGHPTASGGGPGMLGRIQLIDVDLESATPQSSIFGSFPDRRRRPWRRRTASRQRLDCYRRLRSPDRDEWPRYSR